MSGGPSDKCGCFVTKPQSSDGGSRGEWRGRRLLSQAIRGAEHQGRGERLRLALILLGNPAFQAIGVVATPSQKLEQCAYFWRSTQPRRIQRVQLNWLRFPLRQKPH